MRAAAGGRVGLDRPVTLTNWAGNITFGAVRVHRPGTVDELQSVVAERVISAEVLRRS